MLFTDPVFVFGFLPLALLCFHLTLHRVGGEMAINVLVLASLVFYGMWSQIYLLLLVAQLLANWLLAGRIAALARTGSPTGRWLAAGVALNLALLGYFKYRNFFLQTVSDLGGPTFDLAPLFVPLGISFHTFQQIAFLADVADEAEERHNLRHYMLFVLFFPQLIAGPIVLHQEMGRQLEQLGQSRRIGFERIVPGLVVFCFGLFKKVCLADNIAPYADAAFAWPVHLALFEAWGGVLAYALQLFLDFSGYSDMAVGLGLMFGLILPFNFDHPFRATSMIEYWKRWHITMTRFFTMYLYTPLALALYRRVEARNAGRILSFVSVTALPTFLTFLASGLWHGAGWTFIAFGLVNGIGLVVNHIWNAAQPRRLPNLLGWALTAGCILVTLIYFRSGSLAQAHAILKAMVDPHGLGLPTFLTDMLHLHLPHPVDFQVFDSPPVLARLLGWLALLGPLALLLPNPAKAPLTLIPSARMALALSLIIWLSLGWINEPRTFLYFQF